MNSERKKSNPLKLNSAWKQRQSPTPYGKKKIKFIILQKDQIFDEID